MKIFIDAGHNFSGCDTGATGNGLREQDMTFIIANKLKSLLLNCGHQVKMSRNKIEDSLGKTTTESLNLRCKMANDWGADLFVSIHCNAHNGSASGTETLVYSTKSTSYKKAKIIQQNIVKTLGTADRGVKERPDLYVLKGTKCPALLVETAFIDNAKDADLLLNCSDDFAKAIAEGIIGQEIKEKVITQTGQTVMELKGTIFVQEIYPNEFRIIECDSPKKDVNEETDSYFNLGFFAPQADGTTAPVGNLAINGKIIANAKDNADWINLSGHKLTTIYTTKSGEYGITKTNDLNTISNLNMAVSGIPIIVGGKQVSLDEIESEGYFGSELYDTWHGFLGIRHNKLVYVAMECEFNQMCWALVALGIYDAVKVDGGDSFILVDDGKTLMSCERKEKNRRIHNAGAWKPLKNN